MKRRSVPGTIYLIHFREPYRHARHYLGWTESDLEERIGAHRAGRGARLMEVIIQAGIDWQVVRTWEGLTRDDERRLKAHGSPRYCPICNPGGAARRKVKRRSP